MKTFKNFIEESSLSRLWQHLQNGNVIAMFSASRDEAIRAENKENFKELKKKTKQVKFGYVPIKGGYIETDINGTEHPVVEDSLIVFTSKEREKELEQFVISMGKAYNQESVLFVYSNGDAFWIATTPKVFDEDTKIGDKERLGKFHFKQIGKYFSQIGKKRFSFETGELVTEEDSRKGLTPVTLAMGDLLISKIRKCICENKNFWKS